MKQKESLRAKLVKRYLRFGIRKFTIGVASVAIASGLMMIGSHQIQAEETAPTSATVTKQENTDTGVKKEQTVTTAELESKLTEVEEKLAVVPNVKSTESVLKTSEELVHQARELLKDEKKTQEKVNSLTQKLKNQLFVLKSINVKALTEKKENQKIDSRDGKEIPGKGESSFREAEVADNTETPATKTTVTIKFVSEGTENNSLDSLTVKETGKVGEAIPENNVQTRIGAGGAITGMGYTVVSNPFNTTDMNQKPKFGDMDKEIVITLRPMKVTVKTVYALQGETVSEDAVKSAVTTDIKTVKEVVTSTIPSTNEVGNDSLKARVIVKYGSGNFVRDEEVEVPVKVLPTKSVTSGITVLKGTDNNALINKVREHVTKELQALNNLPSGVTATIKDSDAYVTPDTNENKDSNMNVSVQYKNGDTVIKETTVEVPIKVVSSTVKSFAVVEGTKIPAKTVEKSVDAGAGGEVERPDENAIPDTIGKTTVEVPVKVKYGTDKEHPDLVEEVTVSVLVVAKPKPITVEEGTTITEELVKQQITLPEGSKIKEIGAIPDTKTSGKKENISVTIELKNGQTITLHVPVTVTAKGKDDEEKPKPEEDMNQIVTKYVDEANQSISPEEKGEHEKKELQGYVYVNKTTDEKGNIIHHYKKVKTENGENKPKPDEHLNQVVTKYVDETNQSISPDEQGEHEKKELQGYVYVNKTTDEKGNITHHYKKVKTENGGNHSNQGEHSNNNVIPPKPLETVPSETKPTETNQTGWNFVNGKWYYKKDGKNITKKWEKINGKWYFFTPSGDIKNNGWEFVNGKWYYLEQSGAMKASQWFKSGGKWFYVNHSGVMETGWLQVNGKWYYLEQSGAMKASQWFKLNEKWYYVNDSGELLVNTTTPDGYKVNENGEWINE